MNTLYPVFLKSEKLHFLIVGGGYVGTEKLSFLLKSSPDTPVRLVAPWISEEIQSLTTYIFINTKPKRVQQRRNSR